MRDCETERGTERARERETACVCVYVCVRQVREREMAYLSLDPEIIQEPRGEKTTDKTKSLWPWYVWRHLDTVERFPAMVRSHTCIICVRECMCVYVCVCIYIYIHTNTCM